MLLATVFSRKRHITATPPPKRLQRRKRQRRLHQLGSIQQLEIRPMLSSVSVIATDSLVVEGESTGAFVFSRDAVDLSQPVTINYSVSGAALPGTDYRMLPGVITIPANESAASVLVEPLVDGSIDGTESLTVSVMAPSGYSVNLADATVSIRDSQASDGRLAPLSETFQLHSLPHAKHRVFLDFNGGQIQDGGTKTIQAYNSDSNSGFSDAEKIEIQQIWDYIAEDLRPWQVDVTTEQPDIEQLRNTGNGDEEWGLRVTIGESHSGLTAPGRSGVGIFDSSTDKNNWATRQNNPEDTAGLITHEIGHALGLDHDGAPGTSYYDGHGSGETAWGTYMGSAYQAIMQWDKGQYPGADNQQDDLNIITTTNGFDYRPDDHGDSPTNATALVDLGDGVLIGEGIIERNTDRDLFSFTATGGETRVFVHPPKDSPNIDLRAELFDSNLNTVAVSDVQDQLAASIITPLTIGATYYVRVSGAGNRTWSTGGYDNYGSLGSYRVEVNGYSDLVSYIPNAGQDYSPIVGNSVFGDVTLSNLTKINVSGGTNGSATWPLNWSGPSSQNLNQYLTFTSTPDAGRVLDVNELEIQFGYIAKSATVAIRSSLDGFSANIDGMRALSSSSKSFTFDISSLADANSSVEFRVYLWGNGSGWRDLDSLTLNGRTLDDGPQPNVAPVANNDSINTQIDTAATFNVLANDTDQNGDSLSIAQIVTQPANGTVVVNANQGLTYTPNDGFEGSDSFTYIATDGLLDSGTATVNIEVTDTPPPPPPGVAAQYTVNHHPRLQLGDAPLTGYAGSELDQIAILWQTQSAGSGTQDSFTVEYRKAGTNNAWLSSGAITQINTGVGSRVVHEVEIENLNWDTDYEYRVRHLRAGGLVEEWSAEFRTRLQAGDVSNFSFVAYGDSAKLSSNSGFRSVQNRINIIDPDFAVLLGDNVYESGTHGESDARFDPDINPEAATWMASHIDYLGLGNHDVIYSGHDGRPSEENFAVPIPIAGVNSPVAPPNNERAERNFSWDYGDVHFVTFDTNAWNSPSRRDALLDYVVADLNASDARWKIVYGHHPIAAAPDKVGEWDSSSGHDYYDEVVDRFTNAGVDLLLVGHSHTFSWTHPLTGRDSGGDITHDHGDHDAFQTDVGLPQVVSGTGGKNVRSGSHANRAYVAAGWTSSETFIDGVVNPTSQRAEDGFAKIDVTPDQLTISYIAADDGATLGSFTITQAEDTTGPDAHLEQPLDGGSNDLDPDANSVLVNTTQDAIKIHLHDSSGINAASVTSSTITVTKDGTELTSGVDYWFDYSASREEITLTSLNSSGNFSNGEYIISVSSGNAVITDTEGNSMAAQTLAVEIDTTIQPPVTISFQDGVGSYNSTVDTKLNSGSPDSSYGSATDLEIDSSSAKHTLLRFDDIFGEGNAQIPEGSTIQDATLEFTVFNSGDSPSLHRMLTSWSGSSTWNGFGSGVQANDSEAQATSDASFDGSSGTVSLNVTAALQAWVNDPGSNLGWAFLPSGSDGVDIRSSEYSTIASRPKLTVTFIADNNEPPPPPPPTNNAPVANDDSVSTTKNNPTTISILANDTDADGDALTASLLSQPAHGTAVLNNDGTVTYSPYMNYTGSDSFTYRVSDGTDNSQSASVSITVTDVVQTLAHFNPTGGQGTANLTGTTAVAGVTVGQLKRIGVGGGTNSNVWPVYWFGSTSRDPNQYLSFTVTTASAEMADFDSLTVSFQEWVGGTSNVALRSSANKFASNIDGVKTLADSGSADVEFDLSSLPTTPGETEFRIYVFDTVDGTSGWRDIRSSAWNNGSGVRLEGTTLTNSAPAAGADSATTDEDTAITINVLANDADTDGHSLAPFIVTQPDHGTVSITTGNQIKYTPAANYHGSDSFTYRVSDGGLNSNTATVNISVTSVNDVPDAVDDFFTTDFESVLNLNAASGALANDTDVEGDSLTAALVTSPSNGSVAFNSDGSFEYTPNAGYSGVDSFTYSITDGSLSSTATVSITVEPLQTITKTIQLGVNGYDKTRDLFVSGDYPNTNFGSWNTAEVDLSSNGDHEHALLAFENIFGTDLSYQIPAGATIQSATLRFYVTNGGDQIKFHRMLQSWGGATWNSLGNGVQANNIEARSTADAASSNYISSGWREFDVTTSVQAWSIAPETNFGWAILPTDTNGVDFYTSNAGSYWAPRLIVEYTEPANE